MSNAVLDLQDAGFDRKQVEAITSYIDKGAATKTDIAEIKGEQVLHRWMLGIIIVAEAAPYIKQFFA